MASPDNLRLQFLRGDRLKNNQYTGTEGEITLDQEQSQIRVHDGETPGGKVFESSFKRRAGWGGLPGPAELLTGNPTRGFFGEVLPEDFITGDALAAEIGLTAGVSFNQETPWLKCVLDNQVFYFPQKPLLHSLSHDEIYEAGAVFGTGDSGPFVSTGSGAVKQDAEVIIQNKRYVVRLYRGANSNPTLTDKYSYDGIDTHGSEWNRIMYGLHDGNHHHSSNSMASEGLTVGDLAQYSDVDLGLGGLANDGGGEGRATLCQETSLLDYPTRRVYRGYGGVSNLNRPTASNTLSGRGWRPVLIPVG